MIVMGSQTCLLLLNRKTTTVWVEAVYVALSAFSGLTGDFHSWVLPLHFASRPLSPLESSAAGDGLLTPRGYRTNLWDRSQKIAQLRTNTAACTSQQYHIYIAELHAKSQSCGGNHRAGIRQQPHWSLHLLLKYRGGGVTVDVSTAF